VLNISFFLNVFLFLTFVNYLAIKKCLFLQLFCHYDLLILISTLVDTQYKPVTSTSKSASSSSGKQADKHKKARSFTCERCNQGFDGMAALRQHCRALHGDQKYYKCNVCTKLFSHPSSRNIHLRLHSGEKPYECETCGKRFRVSSHLKDHIRVHTGINLFFVFRTFYTCEFYFYTTLFFC